MKAIEKWYYQFANKIDEDARDAFWWDEVAKAKGFKDGREARTAWLADANKVLEEIRSRDQPRETPGN